MKYMTKKAAREEIERNKDLTNYFVGNLKAKDMKEMLRYRMRQAVNFENQITRRGEREPEKYRIQRTKGN